MVTRRCPRLWRLVLPMVVATLLPLAAPPPAVADSQRIVIGRISEKPGSHFVRMRALADHLAEEMAADGVTGVDVVLVDTLEEMRELLAAGRVDMLSETAFMALRLADSGLAEILLREWKQGVPEYHSVFFARADSGLKGIADLVGRTLAFEDPGSTSAYLIPRLTLEMAGIEVAALERAGDPVPDDRVGYVFAEGEINIVAWVHRGLVDAGVVSNLDWENEGETPLFLKDDLVVIRETAPVVRSLMLVRADLSPELKARLSEVLIAMHETEAGQRALRRYFEVDRYDPLGRESLDGLESLRALQRLMEP